MDVAKPQKAERRNVYEALEVPAPRLASTPKSEIDKEREKNGAAKSPRLARTSQQAPPDAY